MPESIEYKGYVVSGTAHWWYVSIYAGNYTITEKSSGTVVRDAEKVVYRATHDAACSAAIVAGVQYVDLELPFVAG